MQKNHLFTALFVSLSLTLTSFTPSTQPAAAPAVPTVVAPTETESETSATLSLYGKMDLASAGLSEEAFTYAVKGYQKLVEEGTLNNDQYLTIVDFSQSSRKKRFYLIDVKNGALVLNTFVSHGKNSGVDMAERFSNTPNSEQSSLGFYVTGETYTGKHGLSMRLDGKEEGFNDNARARGVVVHGANYVNSGRVNSAYMGRSQGCPALPEAEYSKVINIIKDGSVMFLYHPSENYLQNSDLLNS